MTGLCALGLRAATTSANQPRDIAVRAVSQETGNDRDGVEIDDRLFNSET